MSNSSLLIAIREWMNEPRVGFPDFRFLGHDYSIVCSGDRRIRKEIVVMNFGLLLSLVGRSQSIAMISAQVIN